MNIAVKIKDAFIISDDLLDAILDAVKKCGDHKYVEKLHYSSAMDDARVSVFTCDHGQLKITRYGENNNDIKIKGPKELVDEFVQLMAVHGAMLVVKEICQGAFSQEKQKLFVETLHEKFTETIVEIFNRCRAE